jgi:very-short-patch-repair endonuclease
MSIAFEKSFASFDGTVGGKKKVDCWSDRNDLNPREVTKKTHQKFWFDCDRCGHKFESALSKITDNRWCPYCANKKLCNNISCKDCFEKCFASVNSLTPSGTKILDCWSDRNPLNPREVTKKTHQKFWFDCDRCGHEFESALYHITNGTWCPYCANPCKKICSEDILCYHCYNNSFASFDSLTPSGNLKTDCWSDRNPLNPREVCKCSSKKFWFDCDRCSHEFESVLNNIINGTWCPYCCANGPVCGNISCEDCFEKSFASFDGTVGGKKKVDCWSDRNELKPREVSKCSGKKFWFDCDKCGHKFESAISQITNGRWCPNCRNKTELKLYNWLLEKDYINSVKREWTPKWCSTEYTHFVKTKYKIGRYQYRFDFLVTLKNKKQIIIELDGRQHYEQVMDWKTPLEQQIRDKYKEFKAKGKGLSIIRCYQEDVYMDRNNWEHTLCNVLSSLLR